MNICTLFMLSQRVDVVDIQKISYEFVVGDELLRYLIAMTPLTWGKSTERLNRIFEKKSSVTIDLAVIIGMKKSEMNQKTKRGLYDLQR